MDEATARQILTNYGAPPTPQNLMRVMEQRGGDSALLGRSIGLQGGNDESGNALDKLAFASQRSPSGAAAMTELPVVNAAAPVINATPMPIAPRQAAGPPEPYGVVEPTSVKQPGAIPTAGDPSFLPWLLTALGISSVAGRNAMAPNAVEPLTPTTNAVGKPIPESIQNAKGKNLSVDAEGWPKGTERFTQPSGQTPQNDAVDKIAGATESRRPVNTNADQRNSESVNKPVNMESRPVPIDDSIPINTETQPNIKELVAKLRRVRK